MWWQWWCVVNLTWNALTKKNLIKMHIKIIQPSRYTPTVCSDMNAESECKLKCTSIITCFMRYNILIKLLNNIVSYESCCLPVLWSGRFSCIVIFLKSCPMFMEMGQDFVNKKVKYNYIKLHFCNSISFFQADQRALLFLLFPTFWFRALLFPTF